MDDLSQIDDPTIFALLTSDKSVDELVEDLRIRGKSSKPPRFDFRPDNPSDRSVISPIENQFDFRKIIGKSVFTDYSAVIMANLDGVFNLTGHLGGFIAKQDISNPENISKCEICSIDAVKNVSNVIDAFDCSDCRLLKVDPGPVEYNYYLDLDTDNFGFSQYISFRRPEAVIFSYNQKSSLKEIDSRIKREKVREFVGNRSKNLDRDWEAILNELNIYSDNRQYSLISSMAIKGQMNGWESARSLAIQILIALSVLQKKGSLVVRIYKKNQLIEDLVYLTGYYFKRVYQVKPLCSDTTNNENYLIFKGKYKDDDSIEDFKQDLTDLIVSEEPIYSILKSDFRKKQMRNYTGILEDIDIDFFRVGLAWNIPGNLDKTTIPKQTDRLSKGSYTNMSNVKKIKRGGSQDGQKSNKTRTRESGQESSKTKTDLSTEPSRQDRKIRTNKVTKIDWM